MLTNFSWSLLGQASVETVYMVFVASLISIVFGTMLGVFVFLTSPKQALANIVCFRVLDSIVNITRSIPFIILMISILPFTRLVVGSSIGINAAIVPLSLAALPFYARIVANALAEVPNGLFEAATAMGANTWQLVFKFLLPESMPSLVRGASLTIISLIGYSAMAGAVGGGGLGELAINYGYQRFDAIIMLATVVVLVLIVQAVQYFGDLVVARKLYRWPLYLTILAFILLGAYQLKQHIHPQAQPLRVGIISGPMQDVLQVAQQQAKQRYHLNIKIIPFDDYILPNTALNDGDIDANIFQHLPYLQAQIKARHYKLVSIAKTFVYPMGFYSKQVKHLSQLPVRAIVALPNDPSNQARALLLLAKYKIIKLRPKVGTLASVHDIINNSKHLKFKLLDAAQLPRVFKDASLVALTNDFIGPSGLTLHDAIIKEGADSPYANIIVVRKDKQRDPRFKQLIAVMHSKAVLHKTQQLFPHGAAIAAWR